MAYNVAIQAQGATTTLEVTSWVAASNTKVWDATAGTWKTAVPKVWDATAGAWVAARSKVWDGSAWVDA